MIVQMHAERHTADLLDPVVTYAVGAPALVEPATPAGRLRLHHSPQATGARVKSGTFNRYGEVMLGRRHRPSPHRPRRRPRRPSGSRCDRGALHGSCCAWREQYRPTIIIIIIIISSSSSQAELFLIPGMGVAGFAGAVGSRGDVGTIRRTGEARRRDAGDLATGLIVTDEPHRRGQGIWIVSRQIRPRPTAAARAQAVERGERRALRRRACRHGHRRRRPLTCWATSDWASRHRPAGRPPGTLAVELFDVKSVALHRRDDTRSASSSPRPSSKWRRSSSSRCTPARAGLCATTPFSPSRFR